MPRVVYSPGYTQSGVYASLYTLGGVYALMYTLVYIPRYTTLGTPVSHHAWHTGTRRTTGTDGLTALDGGVTELTVHVAQSVASLRPTRFTVGHPFVRRCFSPFGPE